MIARKKHRPPLAERHIKVDYHLCYSCGACVAVCPSDSIFLDNLHLSIDQTCTRCGRCALICPTSALSLTS